MGSQQLTRMLRSVVTISLMLMVSQAAAVTWYRTEDIRGQQFFSKFDWFSSKDPTNGLVNYQTQANAKWQNLSYVDADNKFILAVSTAQNAYEGRNSVRIHSKNSYGDGVYAMYVNHVPTGCSTWPAFWTVTENLDGWPVGGEIDIMENANDEYAFNLVSAHTKSSCIANPSSATQLGSTYSTNCSAYTPANEGCRGEMRNGPAPTWGDALNRAGGGVIAMERSFGRNGKGVRVWYFPKGKVPSDLTASSTAVNPANWGTPGVHLPISKCYKDFGRHKVIINITLCGDWAANTYSRTSCAAKFGACSAQVAYNGDSYKEAYWKIQSLRLFTSGGGNYNAANSPQGTTR